MVSLSTPALWPLSELVIFDCDSTLSAIEGIDELARLIERPGDPSRPSPADMPVQIAELTQSAMGGETPLEAVYSQRLSMVRPTQAQVRTMARRYRETVISDAHQVIHALQSLGVQVFIVSGGLIEPVRDFGAWLGFPPQNIYAVNLEYDQLAGQWWRYWDQPNRENPRARYLAIGTGLQDLNQLTGNQGKNQVIARIRLKHSGRAMLVGDGLTDLEAASGVDLFVGFGGVVFRKRVAQAAPVYLRTPHLSPILPLALGLSGNVPCCTELWTEGLARVFDNEVTFLDDGMRQVFLNALSRRF